MEKRATKFKHKRITMLRELLQMSQVKFADKIRISQGALSQIENGKSQISFDTLCNLSNELNVNCNWVVNGVGKIFHTSEKEPCNQKNTTRDNIRLVRKAGYAAYIKSHKDADYTQTLEAYQVPGYEHGSYRLFEIESDSMMPLIYPYDIVICQYTEDNKAIKNNTPYILVTKDEIALKRIYYPEEGNNFILKSDNNKLETCSISQEDVLEMWQVKGKITSAFLDSEWLLDMKRLEKLEADITTLKQEVKNLMVS